MMSEGRPARPPAVPLSRIAIQALELTVQSLREARQQDAWDKLLGLEMMLQKGLVSGAFAIDIGGVTTELQHKMRSSIELSLSQVRAARQGHTWSAIVDLEVCLRRDIQHLRAAFARRPRQRPFVANRWH